MTVPQDLTDLFKRCHCHTASSTTLDLLPPNQPAVYAFYDAFRFYDVGLPAAVDTFATRHARVIRLDDSSLPESVRLILRGTPKRFAARTYLRPFKDQTKLESLLELTYFLSILNEPRYIGETKNVRDRFETHHDSDFLFKMKRDYNRPPSDFLFFYIEVDLDQLKLVEKMLIHLISPPENIKDSLKRPKK